MYNEIVVVHVRTHMYSIVHHNMTDMLGILAILDEKKSKIFWHPVIKTTSSRSLFKALDRICIRKYTGF